MRATRPDVTSDDIPWGTKQHVFERLGEGHYRLEVPEVEAVFDVDRLRRDFSRDVCGEVVVSCMLAGAVTYHGNLFSGQVNFSNAYRRRDVSSRLKAKARTGSEIDWDTLLDELSFRIVQAEREGRPARLLSEFNRPAPDDVFNVHGLVLPKHHPSVLFGDGGVFKSYLALYVAGRLAQQGIRVLFADWELEGEDHRDRLERLFGAQMPPVYYQKCLRPMVDEVDGLKRQIDEFAIQYIVCDSVAFATDGAPEAAEAAMSYFMKRTESDGARRFVVALYNRKTNLGPTLQPVGLGIEFAADATVVQRVDLADVDEFASSLPIWRRMTKALASGPLKLHVLADELGAPDADVDSDARNKLIENMTREIRRRPKVFTKLTEGPDGVQRIALVANRAEVA
jgi:hypothetical protein